MPTQPFYPVLSDLIDAKAIPGDFEALEDLVQQGIDLVLGEIHYKDLVVDVSPTGDEKHYSITIMTKTLKIPLFGSGMSLVFFRGSNANFSEFPLLLDWSWPIYKYINNLETEGFSYAPEAFLDIFLELADIDSREEFFQEMISAFFDLEDDNFALHFLDQLIIKMGDYINGNAAVDALVQTITTELGNIKTEVDELLSFTSEYTLDDIIETYQENTTLQTSVDNIETAIESLNFDYHIDVDLIKDVMGVVLAELDDLDDKFERLVELFEGWIEDITKEDLYELLIPQFALELSDIKMSLEFPRNWLIPAIPDPGNPGGFIEDPNTANHSALDFTVGDFKYSTAKGFEFENQFAFDFQRSFIGQTGIMLHFSDLKVDMSKTYNIPEADADGRPEDFQGMYAESASVTLPAKWFNDPDDTNAVIYGKNLLIGTGGLSGEIGLSAQGGDNMFWAKIGSNDGFKVGFEHFDINFKQNKVISSSIKGAMEIKKFVYPQGTPNAGQPVTIGIEGHIHDDGDFNLTASAAPPYPIELPDVFTYHIKSLELGKEDDDFYIGTSGQIEFQGFLKDTLKLKAIDIDRLRIYSDGTIEFQGGSIALVEPIVLSLGPVEITVSAIHYGSHQREINGVMRKFNYFGFDGGLSVDPLGVEIRGDGVKFYYCTDNLPNKPDAYLHIQTLHLDLTIPSSTPVAIINGWLSIPEPGESTEYAGGIKLQLPQARITGSADMKLMPSYPAFIIDASIELPAPIAIGPVGIYGFRGLIGYRYVAEKEAAGLTSGVDSWYDYYKAPPRGIHVRKFNGPDRTVSAGTPFSIGAGASLGTSFDNGTVLNIKAMILLSIPSLFMIDGRAAILSARLGLEDSGDPPFFAFIAVGDNSLEFGFGADFKMPTKSGDILKLYADVQAGFFFNDSSKWYVNIGTKTNPITARVLTIVTIKSFLMLSAKGIEAGARGEISFKRSYGPIRVSAWAYIEVGGQISFERPQFSAYMAAGVGADIDIKFVSLYASFDVILGVEASKPFKIYGEFRVCVKISILWVFKFKFCGNLSLSWEFNSDVDRSPINPLVNPANAGTIPDIVKGVNMLSNETFELAYLGANAPGAGSLPASIVNTIIPMDTYIDLKTEKGLDAIPVESIIGGVNNPAKRHTENIPPQNEVKGKPIRQVTHRFSIESIELKSWNPQTSNWEDYHPYRALYPANPLASTLKIGQFQKTDGQYNTIRLMANNPFSYTEQGQPGWYTPEQYGITPAALFCEGEREVHDCANFLQKPLNQKYYCFDENHMFYSNQVAFYLYNKTDDEYGSISTENNPFNFDQSLKFENTNILQIRLPEPSLEVYLKLTTFSSGVIIRYWTALVDDSVSYVTYGNPDPNAIDPNSPYEVHLSAADLNNKVIYDQPTWAAVSRIEIIPQYPNSAQIQALQDQIADIDYQNNLIFWGIVEGNVRSTRDLEIRLEKLKSVGCSLVDPKSPPKKGKSGRISSFGSTLKPAIKGTLLKGDKLSPKCPPDKLCELYFALKKIDNCLLTEGKVDWENQIDCAKKAVVLIYEFDKLYPACELASKFGHYKKVVEVFVKDPSFETQKEVKQALAQLLDFLNEHGDCQEDTPEPCYKDKELCAIWERLFEIRNNCLVHPSQYNKKDLHKYISCFEKVLAVLNSMSNGDMADSVHEDMKIIVNFIEFPSPDSYEAAWEALQTVLQLLLEEGNCDCQEEDRKCHTLLHEVCWMSVEKYYFNIGIPGQAAIEADAQATIDSINHFIQPIWRPDTHYYVRFVLRDSVDLSTNNPATHDFSYTYGFSTAGPVGYFHEHVKATYGDYLDDNGNTVEDANGIVRNPAGNIIPQNPPLTPHPEKYALTSLRQYIDYKRSYPNADGNLLSAKPLFYNDETTRISLFFAKAFAYHFFQEWPAYNGQAAVKGQIKIVIKDPKEGESIVNPPYLDYDPADTDHTHIPQTIEYWHDDPNPQIPHVFDQYANLMEANNCIPLGGNTIIPKSSYLSIVPKHLKPLKLYTAIVNNLYDLDGDNAYDQDETKEVHKFIFQTSRYATFKEQVNSYILSDNDPSNPTTKNAVFEIKKGFTATEIQAAYDTITGTANAMSDGLILSYQHAYDRIVEGIFGFEPLQEAISTEFNVIKNANDNDKIIAIIIRNPEPFNNPKIPLAEIQDTIQILNNAGNPDMTYKLLFSKDYSQAIIMKTGLTINGGMFDFKFQYKLWNGSQYIVPGTPQYSTDEVGTIIINNLELQ